MYRYTDYLTTKLIHMLLFSFLVIFITAGGSIARPNIEKETPELYKGIFNFVRNNGQVVINDRLFSVDENTHYKTKDGRSITLKSFGDGDKVLFSASEERVIKELVLQKKGVLSSKLSGGIIKREPSHQHEIHLENGVWKN